MNGKNTYMKLEKNKIEGVMFRPRNRYGEMGEKTSNYFLSLVKRQGNFIINR